MKLAEVPRAGTLEAAIGLMKKRKIQANEY
jgi:hypothetical protein